MTAETDAEILATLWGIRGEIKLLAERFQKLEKQIEGLEQWTREHEADQHEEA